MLYGRTELGYFTGSAIMLAIFDGSGNLESYKIRQMDNLGGYRNPPYLLTECIRGSKCTKRKTNDEEEKSLFYNELYAEYEEYK